MRYKKYLITGGSGFIGSALARKLLSEGNKVRIFDNNSRGSLRRIQDVINDIEFIEGDIRDKEAIEKACKGIDCVCHLASVNGTEFFYKVPELVLEVSVKGIINVIDGCIKEDIPELIVASSSEVYQTPLICPTDETAPLTIPDVLNPRYSYGGGKIISELMAINYGRKYFKRVIIFRPHNVYGPDMGWEHVIPQFVLKIKDICKETSGLIRFPIQGTGKETRAFVFIDDFIDGLLKVIEHGEHLGVYHIGTREEISIEKVAKETGKYFNIAIEIVSGESAKGGTLRRCPDISKLEKLGYKPKILFKEGLQVTADWYNKNASLKP